jgi:hypothetical protein
MRMPMRMLLPACLSALAAALMACDPPGAANVPPTEAARTAPPPRLEPTASFDAALASAGPASQALEAQAAELADRAAGLRARAATLGAPVIDPDTRDRLEAAE